MEIPLKDVGKLQVFREIKNGSKVYKTLEIVGSYFGNTLEITEFYSRTKSNFCYNEETLLEEWQSGLMR